jgi:hypothetical protein
MESNVALGEDGHPTGESFAAFSAPDRAHRAADEFQAPNESSIGEAGRANPWTGRARLVAPPKENS